jgi:phosphoribosylformylglycinamidine synthase II
MTEQKQSSDVVNVVDGSEEEVYSLCQKLSTGLSTDEIKKVKEYYSSLGRNPTDLELQTIAQTWSEHCFHKTFKGEIILEQGKKIIRNPLSCYIKRATHEINAPWCISTFEDNAGIIKFKGKFAIAAKVETHNHPSAVEPFGGAATGVGGVIRDILGVWATPIACIDMLGFGPFDSSLKQRKITQEIPLSQYLMKGVVSGIGSYGNNMGIPTINGSVFFDESYVGYTIVVCGCVGLLNLEEYKREASPGHRLILAGGKTGRDGIHGVTFASSEIRVRREELRPAVQIPNPIEEEKMQRAILQVAKLKLGSAITDLGGGGLSCAVCEMARNFGCGASIELDRVSLKAPDLLPWEIWVSESQERMLLSVPPENVEPVIEIFENEEVEAFDLGELTTSNYVEVFFHKSKIGHIDLDFLFEPPKQSLAASFFHYHNNVKQREGVSEIRGMRKSLVKILSSCNVASKEAIIRTYDHEVKGNTVIKPLQGSGNGPNDASVLKPLDQFTSGIAVSNGVRIGKYGVDTYNVAASAIDEAVRNNISVGGRRISLIDNFIWPSPKRPNSLGDLVRAAEGCYEIAKELGTPFISGKDSLYNETPIGPIAPTLVITAIGIVPDIAKTETSDFKRPGNPVYIIGNTYDELGGSEYYKITSAEGGEYPRVRSHEARQNFNLVTKAIDAGLIVACHDISEGGLLACVSEMTFGNSVGVDIDLSRVPIGDGKSLSPEVVAFSESNSRFVVEVRKSKSTEFEKISRGMKRVRRIGFVKQEPVLTVSWSNGYKKGRNMFKEKVSVLRKAWLSTFGV